MITIDRGVEPRGLRNARVRRLAAALEEFDRHGAPSPALEATLRGYGSRATKDALYKAQHKKCAWCERRADDSSNPVEHYRPKYGAWRHKRGAKRSIDAERYWWLTWTWENLFFSCVRCNDQAHKANFFPLKRGSPRLQAPGRPVPQPQPGDFFCTTSERPLLIDPACQDPMKHIRWKPVSREVERRNWSWKPHGLTPEGRRTIEVLDLDELCDFASDHLVGRVLPSIEEIEGHLGAGRIHDARSRWDRLLKDVLAPAASLSAVTYWALQEWMPPAMRRTHGLAAPKRPGALLRNP